MNRKSNLLVGFLAAASLALAACGDDDDGGITTPPQAPEPPAAPTGVTATADGNDVTVSWSGSGDSFTVQRQSAGTGFASVATGVTGTSYTDSGVQPGTYSYRVIAVAGGLSSNPSDPALVEVSAVDLRADLSGTIGDGEVRTLHADSIYILSGIVTVADGGELRIPAGTVIKGNAVVQPSALIVRTGGKIFSEGTADAPVVFTSSLPDGERRAGDWGGVVINGKSLCNFPAGECVGEGSSGSYGGNEIDDDSGVFVYTRVEFAGFEVSFGNEINALTLNGVGAGTEIHHVQTNVGLDDGIEFFGGTVDLKYAIVTNASDDSFDYSTGWQGRGQFWIVQQDPDDADNGFEVDGNENDYKATPLTQPTIFNVTLVGGGDAATDGADGLRLRRGTAGLVANTVVIGFADDGLDVDNVETFEQGLEIRNSVLSGNKDTFESGEEQGYTSEGFFMTDGWMNRVLDDVMMADPFNREAPDFTPVAGSPLLDGAMTPPSDDFFTMTDYIGAAAPSGDKWWMGWTSFVVN